MLTFKGAVIAFDRVLTRLRVRQHRRPTPRCVHYEVRSDAELRAAVRGLQHRSAAAPVVLAQAIRELAELNTPALLLHIREEVPRVHVMLRPWDRASMRFRGREYLVDVGSESVEGVEAFLATPHAHTTALYPSAPDHPVHVVSIEHHGEKTFLGDVPPWLTHVTIMVNGVVRAWAEPVLHERGLHVWAA
jgi:hypothetical protein